MEIVHPDKLSLPKVARPIDGMGRARAPVIHPCVAGCLVVAQPGLLVASKSRDLLSDEWVNADHSYVLVARNP
jgi:hypothetical protein